MLTDEQKILLYSPLVLLVIALPAVAAIFTTLLAIPICAFYGYIIMYTITKDRKFSVVLGYCVAFASAAFLVPWCWEWVSEASNWIPIFL